MKQPRKAYKRREMTTAEREVRRLALRQKRYKDALRECRFEYRHQGEYDPIAEAIVDGLATEHPLILRYGLWYAFGRAAKPDAETYEALERFRNSEAAQELYALWRGTEYEPQPVLREYALRSARAIDTAARSNVEILQDAEAYTIESGHEHI